MTHHLAQARHNEEFLALIETHLPDNYFDWKITVVFYASLHYLRALEKFQRKNINGNHKDLNYHINPKNKDAKMPIDQKCVDSYMDLFNMARTSRYYGIKDPKIHLSLLKYNLETAKDYLALIKKYCASKGVK